MRERLRSWPTLAQIADEIETWHSAGAADGFNPMFPVLPVDLIEFAELISPELQRRGLTPRGYGPSTLRERLGPPRPQNRFRGAQPPR